MSFIHIFHYLDNRHVRVIIGIVGFSTPARTAAAIIARTRPHCQLACPLLFPCRTSSAPNRP
jgi:hypothetical protein